MLPSDLGYFNVSSGEWGTRCSSRRRCYLYQMHLKGVTARVETLSSQEAPKMLNQKRVYIADWLAKAQPEAKPHPVGAPF